jgi:tetratricopeptide (TPR) repeat protein
MQPDAIWQRATLLFQQQRWDLAIQELRGLLALEPDRAVAHALLALALAQTDALDEALSEAQQAIGLDPELAFAHRALAAVLFQRDEHEPAAAAIHQAIELDPDEADHRGMLAQIRCAQRRWQDALVAADEGLALDPHDVDCLTLRSLALTKLGRAAEATDTVDAALAKDPDNPYTHQARGWALLHQGDSKGAAHHFQEALRRDPSLDGARAGLVEALKAHNPIYRLVLSWFLWLDRHSRGRQFQILIGAWLVARFGGGALRDAGYDTAATVVGLSWLGLVLLTACVVPFFNLLLLLHPLGRHALERRARNDALLLGATLAAGIGVALYAWLGEAMWPQRGWVFWLVFLLPVSGLGLFQPGFGRRVMQVFCAAAFGFWVWWCVRLEQLVAAGLAREASTPTAERYRQITPLVAELKDHVALHSHLILACALSTWFVLLVPKGKARRRRG